MGRAEDVAPRSPESRRAALDDAFERRFGRGPDGIAEAPGRVNLIGEHLDYNEGLVLPVAIDRSVLVAYARRDDQALYVHSVDFDEESTWLLDEPIARDDEHPWSNYVRGVVVALLQDGHAGGGVDLALSGDVPLGAGLSSSAAVELATLGALRAAWQLDLDNKRLALLGQRAENEFVGVQCGVMDQLTSALGVAGHALLIDCRTLDVTPVPLPFEERGVALVVADSAAPRRLAASAYNRRREECEEALRVLRAAMEEPPAALCDVSLADLDAHGGVLPPELLRRARHVVTELQRVRDAVEALRAGDVDAFGALMNASHTSLRNDFEVSRRELDLLVDLAQGLDGVWGARLTGAGFGGCTVNLVRSDALDAFRAEVIERYSRETGLPGRMFVCRASDGLRLYASPGP
jgi:galactokinase